MSRLNREPNTQRKIDRLYGNAQDGIVASAAVGAGALFLAVESASAIKDIVQERCSTVRERVRTLGQEILTIGQAEFGPLMTTRPTDKGTFLEAYQRNSGFGEEYPAVTVSGQEQA